MVHSYCKHLPENVYVNVKITQFNIRCKKLRALFCHIKLSEIFWNCFVILTDLLAGVGYATMTIVFFLDIYYCIIIAWTLFYLISSFTELPSLPWESCGKTLVRNVVSPNDKIKDISRRIAIFFLISVKLVNVASPYGFMDFIDWNYNYFIRRG